MSIVEMIERLGALVLDGIVRLGGFVLFLLSAVFYVFVPPFKPRLWIRQIRIIGADSLFLIILIGGFTGMVLGLQGYNTLRRFGSDGALGTVVALVLVRELGPVLAALMIAARAGSAMAAELGSMQSTEQIDALTVMAINPVQYLVSPRMLAGRDQFPAADLDFRRGRNLRRLHGRRRPDGRAVGRLLQRYRRQHERPRHHDRTLQSAGLRRDRDVGLLLQGIPRRADGDRGQPRDHRSGGAFERSDSCFRLFSYVYTFVITPYRFDQL